MIAEAATFKSSTPDFSHKTVRLTLASYVPVDSA